MSRSTAGSHGVNLLPLLDVLLCTMGTLIVVLGVVNREARLHPTKRLSGKAAAAAEQLQELTDAQEELELHIQQLLTAREKTLADLENARVRLSGIEDHSRQMEDQLRSLGAASTHLESADGHKDREHDALRSEVMQLNAQRMELDKALQKARVDAAHQKPMFAVVPFEGIYQTSRRPIYIECRGDSVILQPEGIVFTPTDFLGPGGPGNPLAAALRAAQEYWRQAPAPAPGIPNEPYPLLLVRPDGIIAYYLVRDAMSSWDAEFGYELIGVDWKLAFPMQPEQRLKDMETRAVAEARDRLQWLAQASPETFARKSKTQYRMSSMRGGVVRDGGPSLGNDPFADDPLGGFGKTANAGLANGGGNGTIGRGPSAGDSMAGNNALGSGTPANSAFGNGTSGNSAFGNGTQGNNGLAGGGFGERGMPGSGPGTGGPGLNGAGGGGMTIGDSRYAGQGSGGMGNGDSVAGGVGNGLGGEMLGSGAGAASGSPESVYGGGSGSTNGMAGGSTAGGGGPEMSNVGPRYAGNGGGSGFGNDQSSAGNRGSSGDQRGGGGSSTRSEYGGVAWPNSGGDNEGWKQGGAAGGSSSGMAGSAGNGSSATGQLARGSGPTFGDVAGLNGGSGGDDSSGGSSSSGGGSSGSSSASGSTSSGSTMSGQAGGGDSSSMSMGTPTPSINYQANNQQQRNNSSRSLAKNRGRNWALPGSSASSLPIQRPIRIECYNDRLVLLPDSRDQQAQVIPLTERTDEAVDQLISSVRTYTKSWGMAGRSMYWKPQLVLEVKPNAESRAGDLQSLLADSGLDVVRK
jgi:hypothetical protein